MLGRGRLRACICVSMLSVLLAACTANPITGREQFLVVSEDAAIAQSTQAYSSLVGQLEKQGKLSRDVKLMARVQSISDRLIDQAVRVRPETRDWAWSVKVIDDAKTLNAWCMPGGRMAVYSGLIEKIKPTDDELAQVLSHEIAHALLNHGAERMSMKAAAGIATLAVAISGSDAQQRQDREALAGLGAAAFVLLPNSREAETEADHLGLRLAARAGYAPRAAVTLWEKMIKQSGDASRIDWLSTHPAAPKRLEALEQESVAVAADYAAASKNGRPSRSWTSAARNERMIEAPAAYR